MSINTINRELFNDLYEAVKQLKWYEEMCANNFYSKKIRESCDPLLRETEDLKKVHKVFMDMAIVLLPLTIENKSQYEIFSDDKIMEIFDRIVSKGGLELHNEMNKFISNAEKIRQETYIPYDKY